MRNGHACIMSIVFIVLFPLGAISVHLPVSMFRNTYLRNKIAAIHQPIQLLGLVLMIVALALGIRVAQNLDLFQSPLPAHMGIGLVVVCVIFFFQPVLGFLQHRYFKRTGRKSAFGYAHRWIGRGAIILGIINDGIGLNFASDDVIVPNSSYYRNFIIAGVLVLIWVGAVAYDAFAAPKTTPPFKADGAGVTGDPELKAAA